MSDVQTPISAEQLGVIADRYNEKRKERLAADKVANKLKEEENYWKSTLVHEMRDQSLSTIGGQTASVELKSDDVPHVEDWQKFYDYIRENGAFELLERRPAAVAIKERWEAGELIPGVTQFPVYKLGLHQVKGK